MTNYPCMWHYSKDKIVTSCRKTLIAPESLLATFRFCPFCGHIIRVNKTTNVK